VDEVGTLTITGKSTKGADVIKVARATMVEALEPFRVRAKGAAMKCLDYSVKFQYASEYSERCAAWLTRNYAKEFPRIEELAPASGLVQGGAVRAAPVGKRPADAD